MNSAVAAGASSERVPPEVLAAYLEQAGWTVGDQDERTVLWARDDQAEVRIVTPLRMSSDYPAQLVEALRALSFVERRPAVDVLEDAAQGGADSMWVRLTPSTPSGQAPLAFAHDALGALRELVIGSASALATKSLVLPPQRPRRATSYVDHVRVATEPGSFVVRLVMPLADGWEPRRAPQSEETLLEAPPLPYGRRVTTRIRTAATHSLRLAELVGRGDERIAAFGRPEPGAANATELAALASLGELIDERARYRIHFGVSPLAPQPPQRVPADLAVTPAQQEVLAKAAEFLRTRQPRPDVTVVGLVVRLERKVKFGPGVVWLQAVLDDSGREHRIQLELTEEDYVKALHAHERGLPVQARGDVTRRGNWSALVPVRSFEVGVDLLEQLD